MNEVPLAIQEVAREGQGLWASGDQRGVCAEARVSVGVAQRGFVVDPWVLCG